MPGTPGGMVSSAYRYSSSTALRNSALISALNSAVHRWGFSSLSWLIRSMPKLQCIDSSRKMYWYCSAAPVILFWRASVEVRIHDRLDEGDQELVLVADGLDFVVRVENLALIKPQRFHDVLIGVRVDSFFKGLAQQELAALWRRDVAIGAQYDVVGSQRVCRDKEAQVALDDAAFVIGQAIGVLPQRDVARHVHFLRHPMVGTGGQVFFPGPLVFERDQLIDIRLPVDDAFVGSVHAALRGCGRCCVRCCRGSHRCVHFLQ